MMEHKKNYHETKCCGNCWSAYWDGNYGSHICQWDNISRPEYRSNKDQEAITEWEKNHLINEFFICDNYKYEGD
jgi:uncharacterized protein with PIN domain